MEEVASQVEEALLSGGRRVDKVRISTASDIKAAIEGFNPDVVFNLCEALNGVASGEPAAAQVIEELGMEYTGSTPFSLATALDKGAAKEALISSSVPTPPYKVLGRGDDCCTLLDFPLIIKPLHEDGSLGIERESVVYDEVALEQRVRYIHEVYREPALVESYIAGREFNVSLLGGEGREVVLPLAEMDFSGFPEKAVRICTYEAKWVKGCPEYRGSVPICPAIVSPEVEKDIKGVALAAYRALRLRDYGRVDIRVGAEGIPYVIDVNPNPSISVDSGFVRAASVAGFTYERLINRIVEGALGRLHNRGTHIYKNP